MMHWPDVTRMALKLSLAKVVFALLVVLTPKGKSEEIEI